MKTYVIKKVDTAIEADVAYAKELNEEQLAVVTQGEGACLVLAGAGSGKTRTITYRVSYLLKKGVQPENILLLTFTNKAAREMMGRVTELTGVPAGRIWGGTFHGVCHRILRECAERAGLKNGFTILDSEDSKDLMKVCIRDAGVDPKAKRFPSPAVLLSIASFAVNSRQAVSQVLETKHPHFLELLPQISDVVSRYTSRKRQSNAVDFDDLLILTLALLAKDDAARLRYATQFRYVLVDEYQDTNRIQSDLVKLLSSVHGNILVVGDDAQSIYSFRGPTSSRMPKSSASRPTTAPLRKSSTWPTRSSPRTRRSSPRS
jgi:DNA helicase-2/ATP-dependent DNA helicase PcrA